MSKAGLIAAAFACALSTSVAHAGLVEFNNITAEWSHVIGGANVVYDPAGSSTSVRWGTGGRSGYDFEAPGSNVSVMVPPTPSPDFIVGTFTHVNKVINGGTSISGIRLTISTEIIVDSFSQGIKTFVYDIDHWETTNDASPCADGGTDGVGVNINGCADNVSVNFNSLSDSFVIDGDIYSLDIRGFLFGDLDTGTAAESFWTIEREDNEAYLRARITLRSELVPQEVPAPMALGLMGLGLIGLGLRRRWA